MMTTSMWARTLLKLVWGEEEAARGRKPGLKGTSLLARAGEVSPVL